MTKSWDKSRLPSRHVTEGPDRAPHRSSYYAMGLSTKDIRKPFVGVASCWNEAAPCNTALRNWVCACDHLCRCVRRMHRLISLHWASMLLSSLLMASYCRLRSWTRLRMAA